MLGRLLFFLLFFGFAAVAANRPGQDQPVRNAKDLEAIEQMILQECGDKQEVSYGILDVTKSPYNADPTGNQDSTEALQQALNDARDARLITFVPSGRYLVSDTITGIKGIVLNARFPYPCVIMGPREGGRAVLVLADSAPGFDDSSKPKPVIHFWARARMGYPHSSRPPTEPQANISFHQMITDLDIDLGNGNPGAVGINHQAAQSSVIEDVTIYARDGFAGVIRAPGSGGGTHGLTVFGGTYGMHLERGTTQPVPIFSNLVLKDQKEAAILCHGNNPMTVVGAWIEGKGIRADGPNSPPWHGALNLVDVAIRYSGEGPAVKTVNSLIMNNVYVGNAEVIAQVGGEWVLKGDARGWTHISEYAAATQREYPGRWVAGSRRDLIVLDRQREIKPVAVVKYGTVGPGEEIRTRHTWGKPFPWWGTKEAVNVCQAPYEAKGDGRTDDTEALQKALNGNQVVFLPRGEYKISRPLRLHPHTSLVGVSDLLSVISPIVESEAWADPDNPQPLVETADDADASTVLAFLEIRAATAKPSIYALRWRAGRGSIVRNIFPSHKGWRPLDPVACIPQIRIEGNGGGRWYNLNQHSSSPQAQGPDHRKLVIEGTSEPLRFYTINPEHGTGVAMMEIRNSSNIDMYSMKGEGDYTVLWVRASRNIRLFGYGGNGMARPGWPLIRVDDSTDFLLTHLNPMLKRPGHVGRLGTANNPALWYILQDRPTGSEDLVRARGDEQVGYYRMGHPVPVF
jgi:hypothetical protein